MKNFEYTFNSINKTLVWSIPNKFYNAEEVVTILKAISTKIDHLVYEGELRKDKANETKET